MATLAKVVAVIVFLKVLGTMIRPASESNGRSLDRRGWTVLQAPVSGRFTTELQCTSTLATINSSRSYHDIWPGMINGK